MLSAPMIAWLLLLAAPDFEAEALGFLGFRAVFFPVGSSSSGLLFPLFFPPCFALFDSVF